MGHFLLIPKECQQIQCGMPSDFLVIRIEGRVSLTQVSPTNTTSNKISKSMTIPSVEISATLDSHVKWNIGARARTTALVDHLPQVMSGG